MAKAYHRKIKFYWNRYLRQFGPNRDMRTTNILRNSLTVVGHAANTTFIMNAKWIFFKFSKKYIAEKRMQKQFTIPGLMAEKIKTAITKCWYTRLLRLADLDEFFDNEAEIMARYYTDKGKKNKKMRDLGVSLRSIATDTKLIVLAHWYVHKMSASNLINAIFYNATK